MQCPCETDTGTETILAYLGGRLEEPWRARLEEHLETCAACRQLLLAQNAVFDALEAWQPEPVSADFDRRLYARIAADNRPSGWLSRLLAPLGGLSVKPALVVATACLVLLAGVLMKPVTVVKPVPVATSEPVDVETVERVSEDLEMLLLLDPVQYEQPEAKDEAPAGDEIGVLIVPRGVRRCV